MRESLTSINTVSAVPYGIVGASAWARSIYAAGPIGRMSHGLCVVVTAPAGQGAPPRSRQLSARIISFFEGAKSKQEGVSKIPRETRSIQTNVAQYLLLAT